jgi:hypothetical protein
MAASLIYQPKQYLALCPLCAAKYDEFVKTDDEVMAELRKDIPKVDDLNIVIEATMGHKNSFKLKKSEVEAGK